MDTQQDDTISSVSFGGVSDTDRMIFTVLSNPQRFNTDRLEDNLRDIITSHEHEHDHDMTPRIEEEVEPVREFSPPPKAREQVARPEDSPPPREQVARPEDSPPRREQVARPEDSPPRREQVSTPPWQRPVEQDPDPPPMHAEEIVESDPPAADTGSKEEVSVPRFEYTKREDEELQKRSALFDLQQLRTDPNVTLTREWSMEDPLEDMLLEIRRHSIARDERTNVCMMRDGMRLMITGIEMLNNRMGILDLDGWSTEVCRDLEKHDPNLSRIYRKYWKRSTNSSPEMSIAMSVFGSMGMHHLRRTMTRNMMNRGGMGGRSRPRTASQPPPDLSDSSDDEAPPPRRV